MVQVLGCVVFLAIASLSAPTGGADVGPAPATPDAQAKTRRLVQEREAWLKLVEGAQNQQSQQLHWSALALENKLRERDALSQPPEPLQILELRKKRRRVAELQQDAVAAASGERPMAHPNLARQLKQRQLKLKTDDEQTDALPARGTGEGLWQYRRRLGLETPEQHSIQAEQQSHRRDVMARWQQIRRAELEQIAQRRKVS